MAERRPLVLVSGTVQELPSGDSLPVGRELARKKVRLWSAQGNATGLTLVSYVNQVQGTATSRSVATTNLFTSASRLGYVATGAGAAAGTRHNVLQFFRGDETTGPGGFEYIARFGLAAHQSDQRGFMGMIGTGSGTNTTPSSLTNIAGVGYDVGDTNFSVYVNDGSGSATKTSLGANFPCNTSNADLYELRVFCAPGASGITITLTRLNTGDVAEVTETANIPAASQLLASQIFTYSIASVAAIDVVSQYLETDY